MMMRFLRDRLLYIAFFLGFGVLALAVVQFDLWLSGATLRMGNLLYVALFGLISLLLFLVVDYQRQAEFDRHVSAYTGEEALDQLGVLPEGRTEEQRLFRRAFLALYGRLRAELTAEQRRGEQTIHLISQWAHHMKTPVAVIDLELQKARKSEVTPEVDGLLTSLSEENLRLRNSLQALLNMVRLQDFAADLKVERIDLPALVRRLVNEQKRAFIAHRVYPKVELPSPEQIPTELLTVRSDAKWLQFVLEQVVSNAIKYAARPDREGQVTFRWRRDEQDLLLEVADDGIGIPPEELGRVFTPFFTGLNGRLHRQATGMGLYLAREVCQRLGHRITIASQRGEGTHVFIRFFGSRSIFATTAAQLTEE